MLVLSVDMGTTHCKAGLYDPGGSARALASLPMSAQVGPRGSFYNPDWLWDQIRSLIRQVLEGQPGQVAALGIAGMAESGLLVDARTGEPRSPVIPWFDTSARAPAARLRQAAGAASGFVRWGIHPTFKCSLAKILDLGESGVSTQGAIWLSVPDYVAFRLTGRMATDPSLATRTGAFRLDTREWDADWLREWGLDAALFPPIVPAGQPVGPALTGNDLGLAAGTPVTLAGHDHVCAALAAGAIQPGVVLDSMGTAETLVGAREPAALSERERASGLLFGCHVVPGLTYWMGSLSSSGGAVEWLRRQLAAEPLAYADLDALVADAPPGPTGILFLPFLSGVALGRPDETASGVFAGLTARHGRAHLAKAVLEGTALEMERVRRAAESISGEPIQRAVVVGGGTHNHPWLQIKADISGCRLDAWESPEATLLGAAMMAGVAGGLFAGSRQARDKMAPRQVKTFVPDAARHAAYRELFEQRYMPLCQSL